MAADNEEENLLALERWEGAQTVPPTLWDVLATGDTRLIAAYVTRTFRQAAAEAVEQRTRLEKVRVAAVDAFDGDAARAEAFLWQGHSALDGATPLARAVSCEEGARRVVDLLEHVSGEASPMLEDGRLLVELDILASPALLTFFRIAELWTMTDDEQMRVLDLSSPSMLNRWREDDPAGFDRPTLERISHVFGIFKAINILLPDTAQADAWMRAPNKAWLFKGRSAIELIVSGDLDAIAAVRHYLDTQLSA